MTELTTDLNRYRRRLPQWLPWVCTFVLLAAILGDRRLLHQPSGDAASYHERIRAAAEAVPLLVGKWIGREVPVPQGAVTLLKPNVIMSRRFEEMGSDRHISVLFVQCKDARDILGHYPPVCYVNQGWTMKSAEPADWNTDGIPIYATRYAFVTPQHNEVTIDNFMVLPNTSTARNMDDVERIAQDRRQKFFGAAQVQLVFDWEISDTDRAELRTIFVRMLKPILNEIMQPAGESHQ